jgi:hypothetical protein
MELLPQEILADVFEFIPFRQRKKFAAVCRYFRKVMMESERLWPFKSKTKYMTVIKNWKSESFQTKNIDFKLASNTTYRESNYWKALFFNLHEKFEVRFAQH